MILGACTWLSCYLAVASAKPNSSKSNGSSAIRHDLCCQTGCYSGILSMSTSKRGKNTVFAGEGDEGFMYSGADVDIDAGIVDGCKQSDCALLGGKTAKMPGLYREGDFDLCGCAVGIAEKDSIIDGKNIIAGDILIGLPSSGVHSNDFSLVRRIFLEFY
ncbi:unnamed protein product [Trifolium pratense]|uniref:Uncharacterized protein n=1 Tax=Trifolium pratense TaxID=57577 RepID=A0ACB0IM84_TRIPR|nr:unnamed protein product [Trifolium pratense]